MEKSDGKTEKHGVESEEATTNYESEQLLEDLGGCGKFQIAITTLIIAASLPSFMSGQIDTFGIYNPGWKCVGNATSSNRAHNTSSTTMTTMTTMTTTTEATTTTTTKSPYGKTSISTINATKIKIPEEEVRMWIEYGKYSCAAYAKCPQVEFSPDASTILTEWRLACDRNWILSTLLSVLNAGNVCSVMFVGYISDRFGRKYPYILSRVALVVLSIGVYFCESWELYGALSFCFGVVTSYLMLTLVIMTEYVSPGWRVRIYCIPIFSVIGILASVLEMLVPYWRTLRLITGVSAFVSLFPLLFFMPESLRWLSVKGSRGRLERLIAKIARVNKTELPPKKKIESMIEKSKEEENNPTYSPLHLFRKGYWYSTLVIGFINFSTYVVYFAFNFAMAILPGDFYVNLIIFNVTDIPANLVGFIFADRYKRKPTMLFFFSVCAICIFGMVALDLLQLAGTYGIMALVNVAKLFLFVGWIVLSTSQIEIYPTIIRSTVNGFSNFCGALGSVVAPYLIPKDESTFYIIYLCMALLVVICAGMILFFPETKGNPLKDRWDDEKDEESVDIAADNPKIFTVQNVETTPKIHKVNKSA